LWLSAALAARGQSLLDESFGVKRVVDDCLFTEGPVVDGRGYLLFSDGRNDRIMQLAPDGKATEFRKPCGRANGLTLDHQGRLLICQSGGEGGGRRVTRLEANGSETVLAAEYEGKPFNAPNDICVDPRGRIYFTDPNFGPPADARQPVAGVYRIDEPGRVRLVIKDLQRPNGIVITGDGSRLFVSDRGTQKLHRFRVAGDEDPQPDGIVYDFAPDRGVDGMRLDEQGNIWAAAGQNETTGLFVISPAGKLLLHKPMPEFSTNLAFGGSDRRDLYLTATTSVYRMRTTIAGAPTPTGVPGRQATRR
jgi:gluconolactonase